MRIWLRLLIVWFIAIALPLQGMAGVTMVHCAPSHERMGGAMPHQHQHADHAVDAAHQHAAELTEGATHAGHGTVAQAEAQSGKLSDLAQSKCSSCASCCAGFALPIAPPRVPQPMAAAVDFAQALVTVDTFASDGPDRPPRIHLV